MSVYFIRVGRYIKVGYSENPEQRFRRLFSSTTSYSAPWDAPRALKDRSLLGYAHGSKDDEGRAHAALAEFGVGCEFFLDEQPVRDFIAQCLDENRVVTPHIPRSGGAAEFVGQVPSGSDPEWSLSGITAARKSA